MQLLWQAGGEVCTYRGTVLLNYASDRCVVNRQGSKFRFPVVLPSRLAMTDELIAYLLDDLSAARRKEVEQQIEQDPAWQEELERLRACLEQTAELTGCNETTPDAPDDDAPDDLALRTCTLVDSVCDGRISLGLSESSDKAHSGSRWSLSDLFVAVGVLFLLAALAMPMLQQSRDDARRTTCQNNLRVLGTALFDYADAHRELPPVGLNENAGAFAVKLVRAGYLTPQASSESLVCPGSALAERTNQRQVLVRILSRPPQSLGAPTQFHIQMWPLMSGSYAYRLGYFDDRQEYQQVKFTGCHSPMLSDAPSLQMASFGSDNHGGKGQNMMYQDLSVKYVTDCSLRRDDGKVDHPFLNDNQTHAAGLSRDDVVLGRSECTPLGPLSPVSRSVAMRCTSNPAMFIFVSGLHAEASAQD